MAARLTKRFAVVDFGADGFRRPRDAGAGVSVPNGRRVSLCISLNVRVEEVPQVDARRYEPGAPTVLRNTGATLPVVRRCSVVPTATLQTFTGLELGVSP